MRSGVEGRLDGVVIGVLLGFGERGEPLVVFPGNPREEAVAARSTAALAADDVGARGGAAVRGRRPGAAAGDRAPAAACGGAGAPDARAPPPAVEVVRDGGERLELRAEQEIVLRCGKATITLTRAGKVLIRGAYISSWSSGANRIKGGSVHLN